MSVVTDTINEALAWFGIDDASWDDCDICEDGSVYYGLTQICPPGTIESDEQDVPVDEDFTITPCGSLGGKSALARIGGKFIGEFDCDDDAIAAAQRIMTAEQFWPNIWIVSDHGNWTLYTGE